MFGYIGLTRLYLQKMKERRRGVIVNIIGAGGERLDYGYIAGAAGNAGLMGFTRAIGGASPNFGVRVIGVNPVRCGPTASRCSAASGLRDFTVMKTDGGRALRKCRSAGRRAPTRLPRWWFS